MENNIQPISIPTLPQTPVEPPVSNKPKLLLTSLVILEIVTILIAVYFAYQFSQLKKQIAVPQPTSSPVSDSTLPTTEPTSPLPSGWTYKSDACNVRFPIPPKQAPYYQVANPTRPPSVTSEEGGGRFWDFPRGVSYPNLLAKLLTGNAEYKQASVMYAFEGEASGYVSSAVVVSCVPNTGNLDNQGMLDTLKSKLLVFNQSTGEKGMEANKYTIQSTNEVNKWGKKVLNLTVSEYFENSGGQPFTNSTNYTVLATRQYLYEVKVFGATTDSFVKETAQKIFDNLSFE